MSLKQATKISQSLLPREEFVQSVVRITVGDQKNQGAMSRSFKAMSKEDKSGLPQNAKHDSKQYKTHRRHMKNYAQDVYMKSGASKETALPLDGLTESKQHQIGEDVMKKYLCGLFLKSGARKEAVLSFLLDGLTEKLQRGCLQDNAMTLLSSWFNSLKQGSPKEFQIASSVLGLSAISVGLNVSLTHEMLEESSPQISQALESEKDPLKISCLLNILAIITLVGGQRADETQRSMEIVWLFIHSISASNVVAAEPSPDILATAIYTWAFLLTIINKFATNLEIWKQSLLYFFNLLEHDEVSVRIATGVAIAVIFETGSPEKFFSKPKVSTNGSVVENKHQERYEHIDELKEAILAKVRNPSVVKSDTGVDRKMQRIMFKRVAEFLEDGSFHIISEKIDAHVMQISCWSKFIQMKFLKEFIGVGFVKHMQENIMLQDLFDFTPKEKTPQYKLVCEREEVLTSTFLPEVRKKDCSQRIFMSPNSVIDKERTKLMNKKRTISKEHRAGHFAIGYDD